MDHRRVVITGLGAVTPLALNAPDTWKALKAGTNGVGTITRFDTADFKVSVAAEVKGFDPLAYLSKSEVRHNDPNVQYAIAASDEAVADAGLVIPGAKAGAGAAEDAPEHANVDPTRVGTYVGSGIGGFSTMIDQITKFNEGGPRKVSPFMIPMMIANMASGAVSMRHHATGPTLPVVTACSTSAHEVGEAFHAIKDGYADVCLAGGSEASVLPVAIAAFTSCMALSKNPDPETACRPFDAERDGFVMGEGAVVLVLEELEHARARGAKIYAEVAGYGNTADAYHITSPDPEAAGITNAIKIAVAEAGLDASEGLYINAHGTSTKLNDASETRGFKQALGEDAARAAHISSTKSMTGHMLGATGAMEAMVCALALRDGVVPPTIHLEHADPECDLDYTPGTARTFDGRWALSTNLGFGGHNAALAFKKYEEE
ncbi:MAG: beta-ketoacyl-ACP synthase II [Coriobacteriia bacterium]|nr:beta-ketoacyl-ACP synthase II [Coriobacteriia bacterium]MBS5477133.1 beta-ketoacyl-ACP synthase II [Coriobacteriia bacterium]